MRYAKRAFALLVTSLTVAVACSASNADPGTVRADVWADNWFALYANGKLIKEDSVAYNTERSFNSESFSFDINFPVQLAVIIKDFKEDDTGLEYIGSARQQMGDGGFKAQFVDTATGQTATVSNDEWRCLAIHRAPLNKNCERSANPSADCQSEIDTEPDNWKASAFDDSDWPRAIVHSEEAVRPHGGYSDVDWLTEARLIWTADLVIDNTILCRATIAAPD